MWTFSLNWTYTVDIFSKSGLRFDQFSKILTDVSLNQWRFRGCLGWTLTWAVSESCNQLLINMLFDQIMPVWVNSTPNSLRLVRSLSFTDVTLTNGLEFSTPGPNLSPFRKTWTCIRFQLTGCGSTFNGPDMAISTTMHYYY